MSGVLDDGTPLHPPVRGFRSGMGQCVDWLTRWNPRANEGVLHFRPVAGVAELADAQDSGSCGVKPVEVRFLSPAFS